MRYNPVPYDQASHGICVPCLSEQLGRPVPMDKIQSRNEDFLSKNVTYYCAWCKQLIYDPDTKEIYRRYRRNADEELRSLERGFRGQGPQEQARYLAAKLRAGQILPEQIRIAAQLRHPAAMLLFPEDTGRVLLDASGMVISCAGAFQLGKDIQQIISHLPTEQMAQIYLIVISQVLTSVEQNYDFSLPCYQFIDEIRAILADASQIILSGNLDSDEAYHFLVNMRNRAATISNIDTGEERFLCGALDRGLTSIGFFFELEQDSDERMKAQYREALGLHAFLRDICRLDAALINREVIAEAILSMNIVFVKKNTLNFEQQQILDHINQIIKEMPASGAKSWNVRNKKKACLLYWSNGSASWSLGKSIAAYSKSYGNPPYTLSVDTIIVPYARKTVKDIMEHPRAVIRNHPGYGGSYEAGFRSLGY